MNSLRIVFLTVMALTFGQAFASVEVTDFEIGEGSTPATVTVTLLEIPIPGPDGDDGAYLLDYTTAEIPPPGSTHATAGADYTSTMGTLTFLPGETEKEIMVAIIDDLVLDEEDEDFVVEVFNLRPEIGDEGASGRLIGALAFGTITIEDNDTVIIVNIDFIDGASTAAEVTLTCSSGHIDSFPGPLSLSKLATEGMGGTASFNVFNYEPDDFSCSATQTNEPPAGYTQTSNSCDLDFNQSDPLCLIVNTLNAATITVLKDYTDDGGGPVDVALHCSSGNVDDSNTSAGTGTSAPGNPNVFDITGYNTHLDASMVDTTCAVTETSVPNGYYLESTTGECAPTLDDATGAFTCVLTNAPTTTDFTVTKDFTDDAFGGPVNPMSVAVTLDCFSGLPITQTQSITQAQGVTFTVQSFITGELNCVVTEDTDAIDLLGYTPTYFPGGPHADGSDDGCHFTAVTGGTDNTCHIENDADPVEVEIEKLWVIEGTGGDRVDTRYELVLNCDARILTGQPYCLGPAPIRDGEPSPPMMGGFGCQVFSGDDSATFTALVVPEYPSSSCWVAEVVYDDAIDIDNDCRNISVSAGQGDSCLITNALFFEGIPTLSQYSLAILALLMLGVGMIGFRRFA